MYFHILNRKTICNYSTLIIEKFKGDQKVFIIGDSRVEGIEFPDKLMQFRVVNLGVSGSNTQYWIDFFKIPFLISDGQKVVLWIGVNDFLVNKNAEFVFNQTVKLKTLLDAEQIFILNQIKVAGESRTNVNLEINEFNKMLGKEDFEIINVESAFQNTPSMFISSDGIHLTNEGNKCITQLIKSEIENKWK